MAQNLLPKHTSRLELLNMGFARVTKAWQGKAIQSQYSRLYFIKSGSFYVVDTSGNKTTFNCGGAYLIPSGYSYSYGCEEENEHYYFHIRLYGFDNIDLLGRFKAPIFCEIAPDFDNLYQSINNKSVTDSLIIKSEIYRALSKIAIISNGLLDTSNYSSDINSAITYIFEHLSARLTISEIASAVKLASSTLSAKFRREVGMSVGEYVDYIVILESTKMLIDGKRNIAEISEALGFCDQFYFSRRFKARYGVSPQRFLKIYLENQYT